MRTYKCFFLFHHIFKLTKQMIRISLISCVNLNYNYVHWSLLSHCWSRAVGHKMVHYVNWKPFIRVFCKKHSNWFHSVGQCSQNKSYSAWKLILAGFPGLCFVSFSLCNEKDTRGVIWSEQTWSGSQSGNQKEEYATWRGASPSVNCHTPQGHIYSWVHPSPTLFTTQPCLWGVKKTHPPQHDLMLMCFPF